MRRLTVFWVGVVGGQRDYKSLFFKSLTSVERYRQEIRRKDKEATICVIAKESKVLSSLLFV
jgi:hypothetical protein